MINMHLDIAGRELAVEVKEKSTFLSKHTGKELGQLKVSLVLQTPASNRKLLIALKRAESEGLSSTDGQGNLTGKWKVIDNSFEYMESSEGTEYCHNIQLEEIERLHVDELYIDGIVLRPYFYEEEFDCDDLSIVARVIVSQEQDIELRKLMVREGFVTVLRRGISGQPRQMRFSRTILWSKYHHNIKYELILVDKGYDEWDRPLARLFQPQMSKMQYTIAAQAGILDKVLSTLKSKGLLNDNEIGEIRAEAAGQVWDKIREFYEVKDLDEFHKPQPRITWD